MTQMQLTAGMSSHFTPTSSTSTAKPHKQPSAPSPQTRPQHSVRSQLYDLLPLPKHALFHVKLTIHQLWNVPLVGGEFSVRWKFQKVHAVRGSSGAAGGHGGGFGKSSKGKGKEKAAVHLGAGNGSVEGSSTLDLPPKSPVHSTLSLQDEEGSSGAASSRQTPLPSNADLLSHEARGRTPYLPLDEHNVKWSQTVHVTVQVAVNRETMDLLPSELKLVVEQLSVHGDPDAPQNPRLGMVKLNLAEYADKRAVTRRYLLRESKTNATLQLTIELEHIGGEKHYKAPPLQKGEVMAEVTTLLERSPYGTLPRHSYSRKPSNNSNTSRNVSGNSTTGLAVPSPISGDRSSNIGSRTRVNSPEPDTLDALLSGSRSANSVRTTDNIIEAIFNPVPTSSTAPSPFTYYVAPKPRPPPLVVHSANGSINSEVSEGPRSAVSASTTQSFPNLDQRHGSMHSGQSVHSQADSYENSTSTSTSTSHSVDSSPKRNALHKSRKWWQRLTGSGAPIATPDATAGEGRSRPTSPLPPGGGVHGSGETESVFDNTSRTSGNGSSSLMSSGANSADLNTGVQIFVRRPTSPPD